MALFGQSIQIIEGKAYKDGQLFTGEDVSYFEGSTQVKETTQFVNGLEDGISKLYHANGQLKAKRFWKDGKKTSLWVNWDESGKKIAEASYLENQKHGDWNIWNANGQKLFEMHYEHGKKVGVWRQWDDSGKLIMEKKFN